MDKTVTGVIAANPLDTTDIMSRLMVVQYSDGSSDYKTILQLIADQAALNADTAQKNAAITMNNSAVALRQAALDFCVANLGVTEDQITAAEAGTGS